MEILERARKSPRISENASNPFLRSLNDFMKLLENFGNSSKVFSRCFYDFLKFLENLRNLRKCSGNIKKFLENFGKRFKSNFQVFLMIFSNFQKIFGSVRKSSENFRTWLEMFVMVRRSSRVLELAFEKSSNGP